MTPEDDSDVVLVEEKTTLKHTLTPKRKQPQAATTPHKKAKPNPPSPSASQDEHHSPFQQEKGNIKRERKAKRTRR